MPTRSSLAFFLLAAALLGAAACGDNGHGGAGDDDVDSGTPDGGSPDGGQPDAPPDAPPEAPETSITMQPPSLTNQAAAHFEFASSIAGSTFACRTKSKTSWPRSRR